MTNRYMTYADVDRGVILRYYIRDNASLPVDMDNFLPESTDAYRREELEKYVVASFPVGRIQGALEASMISNKICKMYNTINDATMGIISGLEL